MIFQAGTALALELITLAVGIWVLLKFRSDGADMKVMGTIIGYLIIVGSFTALLSTGYYSLTYWNAGNFSDGDSKQAMACKMGQKGNPHMRRGMDHNSCSMKSEDMNHSKCSQSLKSCAKKEDMGTRMGDKKCSMEKTEGCSHSSADKDNS